MRQLEVLEEQLASTRRELQEVLEQQAATAEVLGCGLVSWDKEHLKRAGALTPDDWMAANP